MYNSNELSKYCKKFTNFMYYKIYVIASLSIDKYTLRFSIQFTMSKKFCFLKFKFTAL